MGKREERPDGENKSSYVSVNDWHYEHTHTRMNMYSSQNEEVRVSFVDLCMSKTTSPEGSLSIN